LENVHLCGKRIMPEKSSPDSELRWSSLTLPPWKWSSREKLLRSSGTTLEQFAHKNPAPLRNPELKCTPFLKNYFKIHLNKKSCVKTTFQLK
jgi:hypothetical protein